MIIIFEQDIRKYKGHRFCLKPGFFKGTWKNKLTFRIWWGLWSISFYPSSGLYDFFKHIPRTAWYD